jgi:hypothetical protein
VLLRAVRHSFGDERQYVKDDRDWKGELPPDHDPRPFISAQQWRYAKSMPWHPHEYVMLHKSTDVFDHIRFLLWLRPTGEIEMYKGDPYRYREVDGYRYWALAPAFTIINRRTAPHRTTVTRRCPGRPADRSQTRRRSTRSADAGLTRAAVLSRRGAAGLAVVVQRSRVLTAAAGSFVGVSALFRLAADVAGASCLNTVKLPGHGHVVVALSAASLQGVPNHDAGAASARVSTMQQVGGSLGVALLKTTATSATVSYAAAWRAESRSWYHTDEG